MTKEDLIELKSLKPYINRIRYMSPVEIAWRVIQLFSDCIEYWSYTPRPVMEKPSPFRPLVDLDDVGIKRCLYFWNKNQWHERALLLLQKNRFIFLGKVFDIGEKIDWHHDPTTGANLPLIYGRRYLFQKMYRMANMQFIRALNRHYHLVHLAKGVRLGKCSFELIKRQMQSWIEANPYPKGINWSDSLDVAIRLFNWNLALSISGQAEKEPDFLLEVQKSIRQQARFIKRHLSLFSSANNHLLGEYIGLLTSGLCHPEIPGAKEWLFIGKKGVEEEIIKQFAPDGVHREQSLSYHWWLLEHLLVLFAACKNANMPFRKTAVSRLVSAIQYLEDALNLSGEVPFFGDCGHEATTDMHYLSYESTNCWISTLRLGSLTGLYPGDFKEGWLPETDERTCWITGKSPDHGRIHLNPVRKSRAYKTSGIFFLRDERSLDKETSLAFRCGQMGYLKTFAHAHADQLSFVLTVKGRQMLIDPGTYGYYFKGDRWREYFRGTGAHNTLRVDMFDQAQSNGNMMWKTEASGRLLKWADNEKDVIVEGTHGGYLKLTDPVEHIRRIRLDKEKRLVRIIDEVRSEKKHIFDFLFHFHPDVLVKRISDRIFSAERESIRISLSVDQSLFLTEFKGDEDEPAGWYSPFFGFKIPCVTLRGRFTGSGRRRFTFEIRF